MRNRINIKELQLSDLENDLRMKNFPLYHSKQIFSWIWQKNITDFSLMSDLPLKLRSYLAETYYFSAVQKKTFVKSKDGSIKYLLELPDKKNIECVFIPENKRKTVCLSSQAGCALGCRFCATAGLGFQRNLKAYEIIDQVRLIQTDLGLKVSNIVFMGMGEPLLNYDELIKAILHLSGKFGINISQRKITISTVGILDGIKKLLSSNLNVNLALSINFADQKLRRQMMPAAKANPLVDVLKLISRYSHKKRMVSGEYILFSGLNDSKEDARDLLNLLKNTSIKINLIPFNPCPDLEFKRPSPERVLAFYKILSKSKHEVTIRKSRGKDIYAGCGQLARVY